MLIKTISFNRDQWRRDGASVFGEESKNGATFKQSLGVLGLLPKGFLIAESEKLN